MLAIATGTGLALTPSAQAAVVFNVRVPLSLSVINSCNGDTIDVSGPLHLLFTETINGNNFSSVSVNNPQGVSGSDETTGAKYQGTGVTTDVFSGSFTNGQFEATAVDRFDFIGQGSATNLVFHDTFHVTFNAAGNLTVAFDKLVASCPAI